MTFYKLPSLLSIILDKKTFPRAAKMQGSLVALSSLSGLTGSICFIFHPQKTFFSISLIGWYLDRSSEGHLLLWSSIGMTLLFPWTLLALMPINRQLEDGDNPKKKGDVWVQDMVTKWDSRHRVRTLIGGFASGCIAAYWIIKTL